jgi:hypothetical protein
MGCGSSFSAKALDDVHKFSSVYQCRNFDLIERGHECPSCSKTTTLYWHSQVHKYRDYTTVEHVNKNMSNERSDETHDWVRRMTGYKFAGTNHPLFPFCLIRKILEDMTESISCSWRWRVICIIS